MKVKLYARDSTLENVEKRVNHMAGRLHTVKCLSEFGNDSGKTLGLYNNILLKAIISNSSTSLFSFNISKGWVQKLWNKSYRVLNYRMDLHQQIDFEGAKIYPSNFTTIIKDKVEWNRSFLDKKCLGTHVCQKQKSQSLDWATKIVQHYPYVQTYLVKV